jgi:hypothetical protein
MLKKILVIAFIIIWIYVPCVIADVVRPSDRVVNGVNIRSQPNSQSPSLGLLIPGEELPYLGSVPRWNIVRTTGGQNAYVSKS